MNTRYKHTRRIGALLLVVVALLGSAVLYQGKALAATLPPSTCTLAGTTRTCDLWAKSGTIGLPGAVSMPIWGYSGTELGPATVPGPALIVNQGETVQVTLHNTLAEASALLFHGQAMMPDMVGAPALTGTKTYTFVATNPGTYLYESGLTPNSQHQVAMGMYGALVVRPTTNPLTQAYNTAATTFVDETLVVLGEIDPALNQSATPATFDMRDYAPKYWLINGKAYPDTVPISATQPITAGAVSTVLLRYVNAGIQHHSMALLGMDQTVLANGGSLLPYSHRMVAETIAPGQTADVIVTVPGTVVAGSKYALYDGDLWLHNGNAPGVGGMLTFLKLAGAVPAPAGPVVSNVVLAPDPTQGNLDVALTATVSDVGRGDQNIQTAVYYIDSTTGISITMSATDGAFDSPTEAVTATISAATMNSLAAGNHIVYVRGRDVGANWSSFNFAVLHLDKLGPLTRSLVLSPNPSGGGVAVAVSATGDDTTTGNSNIVAAEYWIGTGSAVPLAVSPAAPIAGLSGSISAGTMGTLPEGKHTLSVRSQDAFLQWGNAVTTTLKVDKTGPDTSSVSAMPSPNNGTLGVNSSTPAVRLIAAFSDPVSNGVQSDIKTGEGFIDTVGANGTGFPLVASNGVFNAPFEVGYADIPLTTIQQLAAGMHTLYVHGQDASGNWGATGNAGLIIDKTGPDVTVYVTPNPTTRRTGALLYGTATDPLNAGAPASNIVAAEWFADKDPNLNPIADPGVGNGTPMFALDGAFNSPSEVVVAAINVRTWRLGDYVLSVRAKDAAGNWGAVTTVALTVGPQAGPIVFANGFQAGDFSAWFTTQGNVTIVIQPVMGGAEPGAALQAEPNLVMAAEVNGTAPAYVIDGTPDYEAVYGARFSFHPNGTDTAGAAHDIFVGRPHEFDTSIFGIGYRHTGAGSYEIRAWVQQPAGQTLTTDWYPISNAWNTLQIGWESGISTTFSLSIDGALHELTGVDTSAYLVDEVWLGPSQGLTDGMAGTEYFDDVYSFRPGLFFRTYLPLVALEADE